jgi:hypothetical protein
MLGSRSLLKTKSLGFEQVLDGFRRITNLDKRQSALTDSEDFPPMMRGTFNDARKHLPERSFAAALRGRKIRSRELQCAVLAQNFGEVGMCLV